MTFSFMVQDILKRMVLFCKAAVEVRWSNVQLSGLSIAIDILQKLIDNTYQSTTYK